MRIKRSLVFVVPVLAAVTAVTGAAPPVLAQSVRVSRLEIVSQAVKVKDQSAVSGYGFHIHLAGGDLNSGFEIVPAFEYWRDLDRIEDLGIREIMQRDFTVSVDARYRIGSEEGYTPYVGAGFGMHLIQSKVNVTPQGSAPITGEDSSTKFAPSLLLGIDMPSAGPIRSSIDLHYHFVPDLEQLKLNFGIGWVFGGGGDESDAGSETGTDSP
ncbi:MAG: hypothetical protein ACREOU_00405 [Candidatus Eiseniibacteriota bacterium]